MTQPKTVFIETYGCQMNEYDSELAKSILKNNEFKLVETETQADVVMLNTCSVRDNANRKVFNRIHEILHSTERQDVKIGILGCMATNFRQQLLENPKLKIDFIAGPDSYKQLPTLINDLYETGKKSFDVTLSEMETYSDVAPARNDGVNAWLAIMRGCNNFCTFCVVPYTRGRERSREPQNIIEEVKRLVGDGYKQVTLLGQNVNSYRYENDRFTDLMEKVSNVSGIERIRFTSPHPKDFPLSLLQLMAERKNICKQIHLPLQAGNDRVLDKMNRTYNQAEFLELADLVYKTIPGVVMTTDIIVGFPTETESEYLDTEKVVRAVEFDSAFIFKYSERPLTRAAKNFPDDVPEEVKTDRIMRLIEIQKNISLKRHESYIGSVEAVLIDQIGTRRDRDAVRGRTDGGIITTFPFVEGMALGQTIQLKVEGASPNLLRGYAL